MGKFYKEIFLKALADTPGLVSSNWIAVCVSIIAFAVTFFFKVRRQDSFKTAKTWRGKLAAVRDHWKQNLRDGVLIAGALWLLLFVISLTRAIYISHKTDGGAATRLKEERDTAREERDGFKHERDTLKRENEGFKKQGPKIVTKTLLPPPQENKCWFANYGGFPNTKIQGAVTATAVIIHCNYRVEAPYAVNIKFDRDFLVGSLIVLGGGMSMVHGPGKQGNILGAQVDVPALLPNQNIVVTVYGTTDQYPTPLSAGIEAIK